MRHVDTPADDDDDAAVHVNVFADSDAIKIDSAIIMDAVDVVDDDVYAAHDDADSDDDDDAIMLMFVADVYGVATDAVDVDDDDDDDVYDAADDDELPRTARRDSARGCDRRQSAAAAAHAPCLAEWPPARAAETGNKTNLKKVFVSQAKHPALMEVGVLSARARFLIIWQTLASHVG